MDSHKFQRPAKVKNKTPAEVQITAEQILREAHDRAEPLYQQPKQRVTDADELREYRFHKRKWFEDALRRNRHHLGHWFKYAAWEESQKDLERARSVFERALEVDPRNPAIWLRYAEMEMRQKNINLARNLWDRGCTQLPRVDQFWYKYAYMEEMLGNIGKARQIFERWMGWRPAEDAWDAYIAFELRYRETGRARDIYRRLVACHPDPKNWIAFAKFEEDQQQIAAARVLFEKSMQYLGDTHVTPALLAAFARFETRQKEVERARAIYKYALTALPKSETQALYKQYTHFEKQWGERDDIENVVAAKRRWVYEEELRANPLNHDVWFDLLRLEEDVGDFARIREAYERAVAAVPPLSSGPADKRLWRRYIYLWLQYAAFEEVTAKDVERARAVYLAALQLVPHKQFTFAKLWLAYAHFQVRADLDVTSARKTLWCAVAQCPKPKIFKGFVDLELQLREFDRVRALYERWLVFSPANVVVWIKYAELECMLADSERARAIFDLAIAQPALDMPEVLWKAYIDFEMGEEEWERTRDLYEQLLQRTSHVKVWISYAKFEVLAEDLDDQSDRADKARAIFDRAYKKLKDLGFNEERIVLLESWRDFEREFGSKDQVAEITQKMPRVVKRRRPAAGVGAPGPLGDSNGPTEEYLDYHFPDDDVPKPNLKLLAKAHKWKQMQLQKQRRDEHSNELGDSGVANRPGDRSGEEEADAVPMERPETTSAGSSSPSNGLSGPAELGSTQMETADEFPEQEPNPSGKAQPEGLVPTEQRHSESRSKSPTSSDAA